MLVRGGGGGGGGGGMDICICMLLCVYLCITWKFISSSIYLSTVWFLFLTDKLQTTFARLNFDLIVHDNLTDSEMLGLIQRTAIDDHSDFDCFVCCILTHGVQGALYGVNGMTLPIRDLTAPLRSQACPSLSGKPKLFFMQACQGREKQEGMCSQVMYLLLLPLLLYSWLC